jgi:hypothetical protein
MNASTRSAAIGNPLFYYQPQPLSPVAHAQWRLREGDHAFTAEANAVPVMLGEFATAMRHYPLVFAGDGATPVAVLGLEGHNLFVQDGRWSAEHYVPAYVRRYPFLSMAFESPEHFVLAIDAGSDRVISAEAGEGDSEGVALFEDGAPSALTQQMLGFCDAFRNDQAATLAWVAALKEHGVLDMRHAAVTLPNGRKLNFGGFQAVDAQRLAALDDVVIADWQRKGWLAWVHLHLASLERFNDLLERQASAEPVASPVESPVDAVEPAQVAA